MRPTITLRLHGPQGCGKSELARALLKFISTQGYDASLPEENGLVYRSSFSPTASVVIETTNVVPPPL